MPLAASPARAVAAVVRTMERGVCSGWLPGQAVQGKGNGCVGGGGVALLPGRGPVAPQWRLLYPGGSGGLFQYAGATSRYLALPRATAGAGSCIAPGPICSISRQLRHCICLNDSSRGGPDFQPGMALLAQFARPRRGLIRPIRWCRRPQCLAVGATSCPTAGPSWRYCLPPRCFLLPSGQYLPPAGQC